MSLPRRNVRKADSAGAGFEIYACKPVVFAGIYHIAVGKCSGGDNSYNVTLYYALGSCRVFKLLAYNNAVAFVYKPFDIGITGVMRYAAHRCAFLKPAVLRCKSEFKLL